MASEERPLLLCTAFPSAGHFNPVMAIASHMARTGCVDVVFVMPAEYKEPIERAGIEHVETPSVMAEMIAGFQQTAHMPATVDRMSMQMGLIFFGTLAGRSKRFNEILQQKINSRKGRRKHVVVLEDALGLASAPYRYWKAISSPQTPRSGSQSSGHKGGGDDGCRNENETSLLAIGIGVSALLLESEDVGPLLMSLPPDDSPSGKLRNRALYQLVRQGPGMRLFQEKWESMLQEVNCSAGNDGVPEFKIWNTGYEAYDIVYQLSVPGSEYPMSDLPGNVQFSGTLPREDLKSYVYPQWWDQVARNERLGQSTHRVVFVTQGTINSAYDELILPTMKAFASRPDVFVVATLGAPGASLPADMDVPPNARVIDYIPYDVILPHTDVFVTNGGYGTFTHAIRNGVPMIAAGETEEKKEVALRIAYSGAGVNLSTQKPSLDQIRNGVNQVLGDSSYKQRMEELMEESARLGCLDIIERKIRSFVS